MAAGSTSSPWPPQRVGQALVVAAALVVVVAGLRAAAPILIPLFLALFLALAGYPILAWLERRGVRRGLAVLVTVLVELALLTGLVIVVSNTFNDFAKAAPGYLRQLLAKIRGGLALLEERGIELSDWIAVERLEPGAVVASAGAILGETVRGAASLLSYLVLVLVFLVCVLYEVSVLPRKLALGGFGGQLTVHLEAAIGDIQRYLGVKTLISIATGGIIGLWMWALGAPFPLFWGVSAFLLNYIPAVGSVLAAIPAVLVVLVLDGWGRALVVAAGYLAVNFLLGNVLEPRWMGRRFGLSTLAVFVALLFWGWVWGPVGMLLSIPLTVAVKILLEQSPELARLAVLLGPAPAPAPAAAAAAAAVPEAAAGPPSELDSRA